MIGSQILCYVPLQFLFQLKVEEGFDGRSRGVVSFILILMALLLLLHGLFLVSWGIVKIMHYFTCNFENVENLLKKKVVGHHLFPLPSSHSFKWVSRCITWTIVYLVSCILWIWRHFCFSYTVKIWWPWVGSMDTKFD